MMIPSAMYLLALATPITPARGASHVFDDQMNDMIHMVILVAMALVLVLLFRVVLRRGLRRLLVRKANAYCPQCFSARIRRVVGEAQGPLNFFLPLYSCSACNKRFRLGRKPPFARCPECRSSDLEGVDRLTGTMPNLARSLSGANAYRCRKCDSRFADRRPLRDSVALPGQAHTIQSSSSPPGPMSM